MTNTLIAKSSEVTATPAALLQGEIAFSFASQTFFIGGPGDTVVAFGGAGTFALKNNADLTGNPTAPTQASGNNSTRISTTAFVKNQGYITENETITFSGDVSGSGKTAIAVSLSATGVTPGTYPKVTVDAKGRVSAGSALAAIDIPNLTVAKLTDFNTGVRANRLDQMAAPTTNVDLNNQKLTGLASGTNANDAITKNQLDAAIQGMSWKQPVDEIATAPTGNEVGNSGYRVLVDGTATGAFAGQNNSIATWDGSAWIFEAPSANWALLNKADDKQYTYDLDTTDWIQTTGSGGTYNAGNGLSASGNTFNVGAGSGLVATADDIGIDSNWTGQTTLTKFGGRDITQDTDGVLYKVVAGALVIAVEGTDYLSANSTIDGGTF